MGHVPISGWAGGDASQSNTSPTNTAGSSESSATQARGASNSAAAWSLALLPFIAASIVLGISFAVHEVRGDSIAIVVAFSLPVGIALAGYDQRLLRARGFARSTSPFFGIVPLFYLAVRGARCTREVLEGLGPVWLNIVAGILVFIATIGLLPLIEISGHLMDRY